LPDVRTTCAASFRQGLGQDSPGVRHKPPSIVENPELSFSSQPQLFVSLDQLKIAEKGQIPRKAAAPPKNPDPKKSPKNPIPRNIPSTMLKYEVVLP